MYALTLVRVTTTGTLQRTHVPPADSNNSYGNYYPDVDLNYLSHVWQKDKALQGTFEPREKDDIFPTSLGTLSQALQY